MYSVHTYMYTKLAFFFYFMYLAWCSTCNTNGLTLLRSWYKLLSHTISSCSACSTSTVPVFYGLTAGFHASVKYIDALKGCCSLIMTKDRHPASAPESLASRCVNQSTGNKPCLRSPEIHSLTLVPEDK